jgi:serine/threonine-protein kinase
MATPAKPQRETPELPVPLGEIVAGKYRLDRILGSSGMGIVYGGIHIGIDQPVAVKFLLVKGSTDDDALVRFTREAKFMAKINSEHVVRVLDVGALPSGTPFIVMEQLQGNDLGRVLHKQGPLPVETAVDYMLQACEGLATAHAAGVIHRDLKPSNLFLTTVADGRQVVKLIDFGVAKYRGAEGGPQSDSLTQTHVMIGSPRYMAPEQVRASRDVDARADVWSLGIILQELLTGRAVFKGPTVSDTFVIILTEDAPRADSIRPDVPTGLADVITRALIKDATYRTPNVASFASELLPFASPTRRMLFEPSFDPAAIPPAPRSFSRADASGSHSGFTSGAFPHLDNTAISEVETRTAGGSVIPKSKKNRKTVPVGLAVAGVLLVGGIVAAAIALRRPSEGGAALVRASAGSHASVSPGSALPEPADTPASPSTPAVPSVSTPVPSAKTAAAPAVSVVDPRRFVRPAGPPPKASAQPPATPTAPPATTTPPGSLFDDPK